MEEIKIEIGIDQHLEDVLPEIPTNVILHKTICGCGATTMEINAPRHSVIIEPNVPVIKGKQAKHSFIFGVIEKVEVGDIVKHIYGKEEDGFLKIMTTPESFGKVKEAVLGTGRNLYKDFFLLLDECEKVIQDSDYREGIFLPMQDFFQFQNKAMVSATPIAPSDPRFEEQGFGIVRIDPTYDYRNDLELLLTNNVGATFEQVINSIEKEQKVFIFFDSIKCIEEFTTLLDIGKQTNVYCSKKGVNKLKNSKLSNVSDTLNNSYNRFNFLTSRFFSAVDIELKYEPVVIMISEVCGYPKTMIDPKTEAIQIAGRFRNGISRLVHITNDNENIKWQERAELEQFLNEEHIGYEKMLQLKDLATSNGEEYVLEQALEKVDYAKFVLPDGSQNYFMYDNAYYAETVKEFYQSEQNLTNAYTDSKAFIIHSNSATFGFTDSDRRALKGDNLNRKGALLLIARLSKSVNDCDKKFLKDVTKEYPIIEQAYRELGSKEAWECIKAGFSDAKLLDAINRKQTRNRMYDAPVREAVYAAFEEDKWYSTSQIKTLLKPIFQQFNIPYKNSGTAPQIGHYFEILKADKTLARGYQLSKKLI